MWSSRKIVMVLVVKIIRGWWWRLVQNWQVDQAFWVVGEISLFLNVRNGYDLPDTISSTFSINRFVYIPYSQYWILSRKTMGMWLTEQTCWFITKCRFITQLSNWVRVAVIQMWRPIRWDQNNLTFFKRTHEWAWTMKKAWCLMKVMVGRHLRLWRTVISGN